MDMDADKSGDILKTMHLLQEKTPPQNPGMDGPVLRTSRRIQEKQKQEKKPILSPKCLTCISEATNTRTRVKRQRSYSEEDEKVQKTKAKSNNGIDNTSLPGRREGLSEYELKRLETIRQNQAFLNSLNLFKISEDLGLGPKPKATQKSLKRDKKVADVLPVRKSQRLKNKDALTPLNVEDTATINKEPEGTVSKPSGPIPLEPVNLDEHVRLPEDLLIVWNEFLEVRQRSVRQFTINMGPIKEKTGTTDLKLYQKRLQNMTIDDSGVVKVVQDRIYSAAFHPASSCLLMAAGNIWGTVGLLKVGAKWGDDGVLVFEPHSEAVTCMAFSSQPSNLITVSVDGSARSMDLERAVFDEVYRSESRLKSFDFLSNDGSTLLIGHWNGDVALVDRRTPGTSFESLHTLDPKTLCCVHVHPVEKQYFVVAENRSVNIYDLRSLKGRKSQIVCGLSGHSRTVSSAYFSPFSGNRVVTTSIDNKIRVFDTSRMVGSVPLLRSIQHNMRKVWGNRLSAVWDPRQEDCFVIGSLDRCREIQVYHESGSLLHAFPNEHHLTNVCYMTAFHPSRNALLGANLTGRLCVFSDHY